MTFAWKFLDGRSRSSFSGFSWPAPSTGGEPGAWVDSSDDVASEFGIRACYVDDLAWWMNTQLWEIQVEGPVIPDEHPIIARRGRLVRLIDGWPDLGAELGEWAVLRARGHVAAALDAAGDSILAERARRAEDIDASVLAVVESGHDETTAIGKAIEQLCHASGHVKAPIIACQDAAAAAGCAANVTDRSVQVYLRVFSAERLAQSRWISSRLGLSA